MEQKIDSFSFPSLSFSLFPRFSSALHISSRARTRFSHVARAQDRRPSWRSTNYITAWPRLPIIKCSFTCNVPACVRAVRVHRVLRIRTIIRTHREVRGTESCEFGLWIAREWPRGSRHMLPADFSESLSRATTSAARSHDFESATAFSARSYTTGRVFQASKRRTWFCRDGTHFASSILRARRFSRPSRIRDSTRIRPENK